MNFLDLFAGIGGFRLGMESAGHECIGFCEVDKFARASYKAIHDTKGEIELHDITRVTDESIRGIGCVDIICGGFPCQAFSIAGNRRGFEDTRGTGKLPRNHDQNSRVYDTDGLAPTLSTMKGDGQEPKIMQNFRIRKLTPLECWRLQGFPDWAFDKAQKVNSNSQLYKQAGNSVTVNVIAAIAKEFR